ncbi:MAG: SemiSWEET transporter [Erysipelotrichaceae bacterium]
MIGFFAACLTTISFVPQAVKVIKTKDTSGISLLMYSMFVAGVAMWIVHGYIQQDYALIGANMITLCLASIVLTYKLKYK